MPRAAVPRKKRAAKPIAHPESARFFVAPTTPFLPKTRTESVFSLNTGGQPSPHIVDLRTVTANRPQGSERKAGKKLSGLAGFARRAGNVTVPRTISNNPEATPVWTTQALVAFGHFLFAAGKMVIIGLGHVVVFPFTIGLALVDRIEPDKPQPLNSETQTPEAAEKPHAIPVREPRAKRPFSLRRSLVSFAGVSLAIILPLQGMNTVRALLTLRTQAQAARDASIGALRGTSSLADAQEAIGAARDTVADIGRIGNALLERVPKLGDQFRSGKSLLEAGDDLSNAAALLGKSLDFLGDEDLDLTAKIAKAQELAGRAEPLLKSASAALDSADELPGDTQGDLNSLREQVRSMSELTTGFLAAAPSLRSILGETQTRRYLVLFQNNAELRPTGGFIGSFALVDIDRGAVKSVEVPAGGSYDLQGSLKANVLAPEPLRLISAKWEFQDANWFPDFPTSAKKIAWFYQQSAGASVDGVIALNAPLLAKLLDAVGPVNMPEYKTVATGTSVLATAQEIVESAEARESGKPKQFIADLLPRVLDKVMSAENDDMIDVMGIMARALGEKDIQMHFSDPSAEEAFSELGWTGKLSDVPAGFDSLALVRANIAGAKTDAVIGTDIRHESVIAEDGHITDRVTVTLEHGGQKGDPFTGVRNVTYLRLYVPQGSRLESVGGDIRTPAYSFFDLPPDGCSPDLTLAEVSGPVYHDPTGSVAVNDEFGRTSFGVWTQTDPGGSSSVTFEYALPFTVALTAPETTLAQKLGLAVPSSPSAAFGLIVDRQSGADNTRLRSTLKLPAAWYPSLAAPAGIAQTDGWSYSSDLTTDKAIGIVISE